MKVLATTLLGTFAVVLFVGGGKGRQELPEKPEIRTYTQQEIIQQTDVYKQSVRIEDTLDVINLMIFEIKNEEITN